MARTRELPSLSAITGGVERLPNTIMRGFKTSLSDRFELYHRFGEDGLYYLNADIDPSGADTYNTAAAVKYLQADRHFELLGSNHSIDDITLHPEGGIKLETDGGGTDSLIILPHLETTNNKNIWAQTTWGTDQETRWEIAMKTGSAITAQVLWFGLKLTNTSVTATDNDQAFFRFAPAVASGVWQANTSVGGTDTETATSVTVAVDTVYRLAIQIDAARVPHYYINGDNVANGPAMTDATDLIPYAGILESGAAAKHYYLREIAMSRNYA